MKTRLTCTNRIDGLAIVILLLMASMPYEEMRMKRSEQMRREGRVRVEGGGGGLKKTRLTSSRTPYRGFDVMWEFLERSRVLGKVDRSLIWRGVS